jgi:hypothetical protein
MPPEHSSTKAASALLRAVEADRADAKRILLEAGVFDIGAVLLSAAATLRATGHFASAECMDLLSSLIRKWERRAASRPTRRKSGGAT